MSILDGFMDLAQWILTFCSILLGALVYSVVLDAPHSVAIVVGSAVLSAVLTAKYW